MMMTSGQDACGIVLVAACTLLSGAPAAAGQRETRPVVRELHREGGWKVAKGVGGARQLWRLDALHLENGRLSGRIAVKGSPVFREGNVEGALNGREIAGTISDDDGTVLAHFAGRVGRHGMHGHYRDASGEVGTWTWRGKLPR